MARLPLENDRFLEVPDLVPEYNRYIVAADNAGISLVFFNDDGKIAVLGPVLSIQRPYVAAFAKAVVEAVESMGVEWKTVRQEPSPRKSSPGQPEH